MGWRDICRTNLEGDRFTGLPERNASADKKDHYEKENFAK